MTTYKITYLGVVNLAPETVEATKIITSDEWIDFYIQRRQPVLALRVRAKDVFRVEEVRND